MSSSMGRIWQELAEVSATLSCAKDKLTFKLDEVVANIEETDKTATAFKDCMFDTGQEVERSKDSINHVLQLVHGLQMRIREVDDLANSSSARFSESTNEAGYNDKSVVSIDIKHD